MPVPRSPEGRPARSTGGVLGGPVDGPRRVAAQYPSIDARIGMEVEHRATRFLGQIVAFEGDGVVLRGRGGDERLVRLVPGAFAVDRKPVSLARPRAEAPGRGAGSDRTASGSVAVGGRRAKVAQASRIWVEGIHDAALVERVWGDDLRVEGIVVERLDGIDHLAAAVDAFGPGPARRLGVLVDHLIPGSKEARLAASIGHPHVLVQGTPYVDVWQAVRPKAVGITAWPVVERGRPWKAGVCAALGVGEPAELWRRILGSVRSYADLEPSLVGAMESLIDFITVDHVE